MASASALGKFLLKPPQTKPLHLYGGERGPEVEETTFSPRSITIGNYFPLPGYGPESYYGIQREKVNLFLPLADLTEKPEVSVSLDSLLKPREFRSPTGGHRS